MDRRTFLTGTGASLALASACGGKSVRTEGPSPTPLGAQPDAGLRELADIALETATAAGASYADVRIADYNRQSIFTREARVRSVQDSEDRGFGVRVIVEGTWGFAASAEITTGEIARVAKRAVALARANSRLQKEPVRLAPVERHVAVWNTPIESDPFEVPLAEKVELLLSVNAAALAVAGVSFCSSQMMFVREHKFFASTEASYIEQTLHRCSPSFTVTSVDRKRSSFQTRGSYTDPQGRGYEYVTGYPWLEDARAAGEDAVAMHSAPTVEPGPRDLILHPSHLWLTIHESIGHPTELDRALGFEANYAGTSFLTVDKMGTFQLGSELVSFNGEKTHPGALATCGYDDDGVATGEWPMVVNGLFVDYQTTRDQAHWIGRERSHGTSYSQSWKDVPFQRMPNINMVPGKKPLTLDQLIAETDDAILIKGTGSYSIDHQRYNFQFGGQTFYQVKNGKIAGLLKDVAYQSRTPDFWRSCDAVCSADEYYVGGSFYDGKGEPGQVNAVSHGCTPCRFRQISVLNTEQKV
jgi:TldD protein